MQGWFSTEGPLAALSFSSVTQPSLGFENCELLADAFEITAHCVTFLNIVCYIYCLSSWQDLALKGPTPRDRVKVCVGP